MEATTSTTRQSAIPGLARARWRPLAWLRPALLLLPLLAVLGLTFFFAPTDPDYWWHARTGQLISETGQLPRTDIYSFASADTPWITHEWLTELLLYRIERTFGYVANVGLFAALGALTALLVYLHGRQRGIGHVGAVMLMLWSFAILLPLANVRPQMITVCATALCALLITMYRNGARRALWALPPLFALWVNLHGGYVIGLALLGLTLLGEGIALVHRPGHDRRARLRAISPLLGASILAACATLLNPHGLEALRYPLSYIGSGNPSQRYVAEWQSPNFHEAAFLPFAAALLLGLYLGVRQRPFGWPEALWACGFAFLGLQSIRHIPLFAVVVMPLLASGLAAASKEWPLTPWQQRRWQAIRRTLLPVSVLLPLALIGLACGTTTIRQQLQLGQAPGTAGYPAGAVAFLRAHSADPALQGRLFNEYRWAGYLIYSFYPERQVFISAQGTDPYGAHLFVPYRRAIRLEPGWRATLDDWRINLVLVDKDGPLATVLTEDAGWREVYVGAVERLFVRQGSVR